MRKLIHIGNVDNKVSKKKMQVFPMHCPEVMILTRWDALPLLGDAASKWHIWLPPPRPVVTSFRKPSTCQQAVAEKNPVRVTWP